MKLAVTGGIGIFIALIGLVNSGIVIGDQATLIKMGRFTPAVIITCVGLIIIAVLDKKELKVLYFWNSSEFITCLGICFYESRVCTKIRYIFTWWII